MTALIVILITVSLMGSALWVLPSKRERQKMALRMHARKCQLTVQLTSIDLPDKWDKVTNSQKTCAYRYIRPKTVKGFGPVILFTPYEVWKYVKVDGSWWVSKEVPITQAIHDGMMALEGIADAVEVTESTVSVYWNEKGDEKTVDRIASLIKSLSEVR
ncbi:hypothetical protein [Marinomonas mediterranea]|jgi:hypothetical protein|uniref:Uncharacterized protein n=1 Tax=Marinomonas mediterranea (strain ATCC 700492 / JCM 21426 / NBRC 103028 / MMB-1) TaxID=717774 RepID=F2JTI2_MARM1|nr:hypothetical protein [Marinomonas mediterranea]ADZ91496.1 hypothetical protein Marme_2255 [Marinomonas mediterranea MMB-1]WCN09463.1 hypothetical protein GV055_11220 [Marinomonas mediterranea]WCN13539.1 hypothetical protein GV054_11225 [Marinomonas mediterranea]WCN17605.1 hypothetical protein GV053_11335 [Marinomonas mediterranea MMB-1]